MTPTQIEEALARAIGDAIDTTPETATATQANLAAAAAVMALVGPKPLVWSEPCSGFYRAYTLGGCHEVYGTDGNWWGVLIVGGTSYGISRSKPTPEAAQAAAQSHADTAWWGKSKLADMIVGTNTNG